MTDALPRAILFDLDDTLLYNDMENVFLEHYFAALADFAWPVVDPDALISALLTGTRAIHDRQRDATLTNEQVFARVFSRELDRPWDELKAFFARFYEERFPALRAYARPHPEALKTVEASLATGCAVVIATNPLFPARAIEHRLAWAGLDGLPFALVTTYENMHACKPFPAYYTEIADRMGAAPSGCWMIGNDVLRDIAPAQQIGMHTFLVDEWLANEDPKIVPDRRGRLGDVYRWISDITTRRR